MICRLLRHILSFPVWPPPEADGRPSRRRSPASGLRSPGRRIAWATAALFLFSLLLPFFPHDSQQSDKEYLKRLCFRYAATGCYEAPKQETVSSWRISGHGGDFVPRREWGGGFPFIQLFLLFWMRAVYVGKKTRRILLI